MKSKTHELKVRLVGGVGNQLFQFFAGKSISQQLNLKPKFDYRWLDTLNYHQKSDIRDFKFTNDEACVHGKELNLLIEKSKTSLAHLSPTAARILKLNLKTTNSPEDIKKILSGYELRGYYQTPLFYLNYQENYKTIAWDLNLTSIKYETTRKKLTSQNFIALHVRGADYLKFHNVYSQLSLDYYIKSLDVIQSSIGELPIYVFTDDFSYASKLLTSIKGLEFQDTNGMRASEVLKLMSFSKARVISNSTFSYWAAIASMNKLTIAPRDWYVNKTVSADFYPKDWIVIK
jgi:hypothetical protein